jgi:LPS sulfotransferase NodH
LTNNKFIILTHGRAGSTFLQQLLDSHPSVECHDEIFNVSNTNVNSFYNFCRRHYPTLCYFFLREKLANSLLNFPLAFLFRRYINQISNVDNTVGFRLVYDQLLYYRPLRNWVTKNKIPVIHLHRVNLLKAAVSLLKAQESGVYVATSRSTMKPQKINLSPQWILSTLDTLVKQKSKCENIIRNSPILSLAYENFFEDQPLAVAEIIKFLGIKDPSFKKPDVVKLNPEKMIDFLENYEEVKQALVGTRWEKYVD